MSLEPAGGGRLALGTVQFGQSYGIANRGGQVALAEAAQIMRLARQHGIRTLDTAAAYGDSEQRLGRIGVADWSVVSKLPPLPGDCHDVASWAAGCCEQSCQRLQVQQLYGLLVHRSSDLLGPQGEQLFLALQQLRAQGKTRRIGVSVYSPADLEALVPRYALQLVQAPFSVVDRRLETSGWLGRLKAQGAEVHVRSVFLQGLLLLAPQARPECFAHWQTLWDDFERWRARTGRSREQLCLGFVLRRPQIDRVVVGVDSAAQLAGLLAAAVPLTEEAPAELASSDPQLIDPSRWRVH
jgi:aryl-alcohol dehydrogenase-like predicted oxidoreductase